MPSQIYRLICINDSIIDGNQTLSGMDASPDYLHIHLLEAKYLLPITEFAASLAAGIKDSNLYQWGTPFQKDSHSRSAKVSAAEIKKYGQIGIGSAARGSSEEAKDFIGGGEGFLFGPQNFRITKGDGLFKAEDDEQYWTFQVADFDGARKISDLHGQEINGRASLLQILKARSGGKAFIATFDAIFDENFFARSNGILPRDKELVTNPNQTLFDEDIKGGHLLGGSSNNADIESLKIKFDAATIHTIDFHCQIVGQILLKPIEQLRIAKKNGDFRNPRTEIEVNSAAQIMQKTWRQFKERTQKPKTKKIVILGGGIAGCTTAIELSRQGYEIVILEKAADILQATSARTPGRMGLGYHYFDYKTAKLYMENTIAFMKQYADCFLGDEANSYLQNGRYFITTDSLVALQEIMASFDKISLHFERMCRNDATNDIFGSYHLHKTMEPQEFQDDINAKKVLFAIETKEMLLDWQKFAARLKREIIASGILIKNNFEVSDVVRNSDGSFQLLARSGARQETVAEEADYVINCTWQNIDQINSRVGIGDAESRKHDPHKSVTCRLKLLAEVDLPPSLATKHSMFFCAGPHAMFSNLGNGVGRITYAPVTNFGTTTEIQMPEQFERWLNQGLNAAEESEYGQQIIAGVAEYIPAMCDARLRRVIPGIVKSHGAVDLEDRNSPFHKRDYDGVAEQQIGWIDNAAMKLFYSLGNAKKVAAMILEQEKAGNESRKMASALAGNFDLARANLPILCRVFESHLKRNFKAADILSNPQQTFEDLNQSVLARQEVLSALPGQEDLSEDLNFAKPSSVTTARGHESLQPQAIEQLRKLFKNCLF